MASSDTSYITEVKAGYWYCNSKLPTPVASIPSKKTHLFATFANVNPITLFFLLTCMCLFFASEAQDQYALATNIGAGTGGNGIGGNGTGGNGTGGNGTGGTGTGTGGAATATGGNNSGGTGGAATATGGAGAGGAGIGGASTGGAGTGGAGTSTGGGTTPGPAPTPAP